LKVETTKDKMNSSLHCVETCIVHQISQKKNSTSILYEMRTINQYFI
jgi:hypothetical protein